MDKNLGTYKGRALTEEVINELVAEFERDWAESEVTASQTPYGKALQALQALELPVNEIEALERRAVHEHIEFPSFIRSILQGKLTA